MHKRTKKPFHVIDVFLRFDFLDCDFLSVFLTVFLGVVLTVFETGFLTVDLDALFLGIAFGDAPFLDAGVSGFFATFLGVAVLFGIFLEVIIHQ